MGIKSNPEYKRLTGLYGKPAHCYGTFHIFRQTNLKYIVYDTQFRYTVITLRMDKFPQIGDYIKTYDEFADFDEIGEDLKEIQWGVDEYRFVSHCDFRLYNRWDVVEKIWDIVHDNM